MAPIPKVHKTKKVKGLTISDAELKKELLLLFSIQRVCKSNYDDFAKSRILWLNDIVAKFGVRQLARHRALNVSEESILIQNTKAFRLKAKVLN